MYKIKVFSKSGEEFKIFDCKEESLKVNVGKENTNDLILSDPSVSAQHAAFEFDGEKAVIRNLKSRNGIMLNGERLKKEKSMISPSDKIGIGDFLCQIEWVASGKAQGKSSKKSFTGFFIAALIILLPLLYVAYMAIQTRPVDISVIDDFEPLVVSESSTEKTEAMKTSWRFILTKAKDAYFKDDILGAAKSFKKVLEMQPENIEATTFLEQIKKEMVPEIENEIKSFIEERNIVSCATAVEKLKVLDPGNEWIKNSDALLKGFNSFKQVQEFYTTHQFRKAYEKILKVVLVDEETLSEWRSKIEKEVQFTENFKAAIQLYRTGPVPEALKAMKDVLRTPTIQKKLTSYTRQKLKILGNYFRFKKLEQQDPLKQTAFGVGLFYGLTESEDPLIYGIVKRRLDELAKVCGPGTSFYDLLETDTATQMEEAENYKSINEYEFALRNYTKALNGLRILEFFSKEDKFKNVSEKAYFKIMGYHNELMKKVEDMRKINEFKGADKLEKLLSKYEIIKPSEIKETILKNKSELTEDEDIVLFEILHEEPKPAEEKPQKAINQEPKEKAEESIEIAFN